MFAQLLAALAHVHACGVIHQDIKPANIMVDTNTWRIFLIDFGAATMAKSDDFDGNGTIGKAEFMKLMKETGAFDEI